MKMNISLKINIASVIKKKTLNFLIHFKIEYMIEEDYSNNNSIQISERKKSTEDQLFI